MTTESLLVKTKDNYVVVLSITYCNDAEKMRLTKQCENYCQNVDYKDFNAQNISSSNISFDNVSLFLSAYTTSAPVPPPAFK